MTALWQKLTRIWRNHKPLEVPLPAALRPAAQLFGSNGSFTDAKRSQEQRALAPDRALVAGESTSSTSTLEEDSESSEAPHNRFVEPDEPLTLEGQMRALRQEVASLTATLSSEQADRHEQLASALKDLASHAGAHNQSMVQVHEDLQLMTQTQRDGVSRISDLSQAADRQAKAQQALEETVRTLEAKSAADYEALSTALARTRQTILAVTLIATGGMLVLIPMIVALLG